MSKKIISALLIVLLVLSCGMTAFCAEADADALKVTSASYDEATGKVNMTIANVSEENISDSIIAFDYNANAVMIENYQGYLQIGTLAAGESKDVIFAVITADGKKPVLGLTFNYILEGSGTIDLTANVNNMIKFSSVEDIFAASSETETGALAVIKNFLGDTGFAFIANNWTSLIMIAIACVLLYLAIVKKFEPLLLLPIAFGMLLTNLPGADMYHEQLFAGGHIHWEMFGNGIPVGDGTTVQPGLIDILYLGVKLGIYPCLIFVGVGAMTDFGPLIANPKSLLLGAAAQLGIFATFLGVKELFPLILDSAYLNELLGPTTIEKLAASVGIIGGADGPTAIFVTSKLAPNFLGPIAVAAYSYMALVPVIQPPIMKALTTKKERMIEMKALREVTRTEKVLFPIIVTIVVWLIVPSAAPLVGCLMLGNLIKESGVAERLSKTVQNELMNIVTIFLGVSVGATATASTFLNPLTLMIIVMGVVAFGMGTAGGVLLAKFMNLFTKTKINPLIGSAGVSAVPMAARVSQTVGQKENPKNFLLMHAMGPNVAGVIGSAIAAGALLSLFG